MAYSVGEVAQLAHVSVRTLHHYDHIGLLEPSGRSHGGYRQYTGEDIARLQRILFYRELGFPLGDIAQLLDSPSSPAEHMHRQRELITARIARMEAMVRSIDTELEALTMGYNLTPEERLEVWGDFNPEEHEEEAQQRWGGSDAWRESARRTKKYSAEDWRQIKAEAQAAQDAMVAAMRAGLPASGTEAMDAAEAARAHISRWFYDCSYEMHTGLAQMYIADPRFTKTYEDIAEGLAQYTHDAILANAARMSGRPE